MFLSVVAPVVSLLNSILAPMLMIVIAIGGLYCILLGVKYAKAEEPQEREKAKSALVNAAVGFGLIFILILAMNLLMPILVKWVNDSYHAAGYTGDLITSIGNSASSVPSSTT